MEYHLVSASTLIIEPPSFRVYAAKSPKIISSKQILFIISKVSVLSVPIQTQTQHRILLQLNALKLQSASSS